MNGKKTIKILTYAFTMVIAFAQPIQAADYTVIEGSEDMAFGTEAPEVGKIYLWGQLFRMEEWATSPGGEYGKSSYAQLHLPEDPKNKGSRIVPKKNREVYQMKAIYTVPTPVEKITAANLISIPTLKLMMPDATHTKLGQSPIALQFSTSLHLPNAWSGLLVAANQPPEISMNSVVFFRDAAFVEANRAAVNAMFAVERYSAFDGEVVAMLQQITPSINQIGVFTTTISRFYRDPRDPNQTVVVTSVAFAVSSKWMNFSGGAGRKIMMGEEATVVVETGVKTFTTTIDPQDPKYRGFTRGIPSFSEELIKATARFLTNLN